jgi:Methyltransferase domain
MSFSSKIFRASHVFRGLVAKLSENVRRINNLPEYVRGIDVARLWKPEVNSEASEDRNFESDRKAPINPLESYFDGITQGPGVWKWRHYFEIYHRHLCRFVGREVTVVEVGVYSGGSLAMWRDYFGEGCQIHGVDIQPECEAYENSHTKIHIGDQADRSFWQDFRRAVQAVDILIDDGGHSPEQQMVTLEEMLPHLRPGGVYICEDVTGVANRFAAFSHAIANEMNTWRNNIESSELASTPTPFQSEIDSVHFYPFVVVIEKRSIALNRFVAPKHGSQWQPYL